MAVGVWLVIRRKRSRGAEQAPYVDGKAELPGHDAEKKRPKAGELNTTSEIFETSGHGRPAELDPEVRYELEGGFHGHEVGGR